MISIRRSSKEDIPFVMEFISTYWAAQHVLSKSLALMDWQYGTEDGYNFILAWDEGILAGVLGYIPTRRYDEELSANKIIWLALWKVRDEYQSSMLGLKLLKILEDTEPNVAVAVSGVNLKTAQLYKVLGYQVQDLCQYYLANSNVPQNVLHNPKNSPLATAAFGRAKLKRMHSPDLEDLNRSIDTINWLKTPEYFDKRFIQHPFYEYNVYGIFLSGKPLAVIASRVAEYKNSRVLRIVDFTGDANVLGDCGSAFRRLMSEHDVEYMDFWQFGIASKTLERAGFQAVDPAGEFICPNYFEPFLKKNGRIICCFKGRIDRPFIVCRADGDQDRPSVV
jgi:hypothetical protein